MSDPYVRYALPEDVAGYEISDDRKFSATPVFQDPRCPHGLIYGIDHNNVIVHQQNNYKL